MVLTEKQEKGLNLAVQRYKENKPYVCISGYAGSGKSTLVKYIIAALGLESATEVAYVAYTGKAAEVLRHKGCANATTAHKLLYKAKMMPNGKFRFYPKDSLDEELKVIVVDEVSMLPDNLWRLLLSHNKFIIACGDPFQLPPIDKNSDNHILETPHIFLDEIMRQAQESEIIQLTMAIRSGGNIGMFKGNEVQIVGKDEFQDGMFFWADQIITATNNMRHKINTFMRHSKGFGGDPQEGDKIICLRNCWETLDSAGESALVNGTIGYITKNDIFNFQYPIWELKDDNVPIANLSFKTELNEQFNDIWADYSSIVTGQKYFSPQQEYLIYRSKTCEAPIEFNYGYAITCHRAQGSEWDKVLVCEERFPYNKEEHARWLYTACTRASEKLILVR